MCAYIGGKLKKSQEKKEKERWPINITTVKKGSQLHRESYRSIVYCNLYFDQRHSRYSLGCFNFLCLSLQPLQLWQLLHCFLCLLIPQSHSPPRSFCSLTPHTFHSCAQYSGTHNTASKFIQFCSSSLSLSLFPAQWTPLIKLACKYKNHMQEIHGWGAMRAGMI